MLIAGYDRSPRTNRRGLAASIAYLRGIYATSDVVFLGTFLLVWLGVIAWSAAKLDG